MKKTLKIGENFPIASSQLLYEQCLVLTPTLVYLHVFFSYFGNAQL